MQSIDTPEPAGGVTSPQPAGSRFVGWSPLLGLGNGEQADRTEAEWAGNPALEAHAGGVERTVVSHRQRHGLVGDDVVYLRVHCGTLVLIGNLAGGEQQLVHALVGPAAAAN